MIVRRQKQAINRRTQSLIEEVQQINRQLREIVASQERELDSLREKVRRLMGNDT